MEAQLARVSELKKHFKLKIDGYKKDAAHKAK